MGSLSRKILFSGSMGRCRPLSKQKKMMVKVQNDICTSTHIYIYKQISPIFNCITTDSVTLTSLLACQLYQHEKAALLYEFAYIAQSS